MPYPDPRELSVANVGSNLRPRAATRDLRASLTSLGGIRIESKNLYMDSEGGGMLQEPRPNQHQRQLGSTGNFIRVFPAVAEFKDTAPNVTHMLTITVVNRSDRVQRIRFVPPKLKQFALHQIPAMAVAPGLEVSADLEYFHTVDGDFEDEILVMCETDKIKVPVYAFQPRAELYFDSYCLFGSVPPVSQNIRYVDFVNRGKKAADFEFIRDDNFSFTIEPMVGRLGPNESDDCFIRVKVTFAPGEDLGVQRAIAQLKVNGEMIGEPLDMSALVARQSLEVVSPEGSGRMSAMQFGTIYSGETRDMPVTLINDGPEPATIKSLVNKQEIHENEDPFWTITPADGTLQPFEQRTLNVRYHPPRIPILKGFRGHHDKQLKLDEQREDHEVAANWSGTVISSAEELLASLKLIGRAVMPEVVFSDWTVEFIDTPTNKCNDIVVKIVNRNDEIPIVYEAQKVPHFRARPSKGRLLPYQAHDIVITFSPAQRGMHKQTMPFFLYGSTGQKVGMVDLRMLGNCGQEGKKVLVGGVAATDATFEPKFTFQGPEQLHIQKTAPRTKRERENAWNKFPPVVDDVTVAYTFEAERFDAIKNNENKYLRWLRGKYAERLAVQSDAETPEFALGNHGTGIACGDHKGDPDYEKPALELGLFGLPAKGLPPGKSLREPLLHLPVADEPLFLKHPPGEGPTYIKPKSKPMDENRLMLNKFKPHPTTKKEKQDCSSHLSPKQIMQISTHPSKMQFGSVCVQSPISKSFTISNGTLGNMIVRIDCHGDRALERSTPETQVVPSGATAGFDITLYLEATSTVDTKFSYIINEHHTFEVPITAQAVPVMLNMSRDKISFVFNPNSNLMGAPETLYLINPSNNLAEYKFESNPNFAAFPRSGTVEPMSQEAVEISYKPGQQTSHEAIVSIDVMGGQPIKVQCVGECDEGHIECKPRNIDFGSVAAGTSARKAITLHGKGNANNVFFVDPDELRIRCPGLTVVPERGMISPGTNLQLVVSVNAKKPQKLDSYFVVQVRGGKNIKVPVKIDINVPVVKIKQEELDFGEVYLGAEQSVPLTIENVSNIPAIFTLDLRKFPEFKVKVPEDLEYDDDTEADSREAAADAHGAPLPDSDRQGPIHKICVAPDSQGTIQLSYHPETIGNLAFELPLSLLGVSGKDAKSLRRAVVAESAKPRLLLSTPTIDFEKRIVVNENLKDFSYAIELTLTNCDDEQCLMNARLQGDDVAAGVFKMADTTADLAPGKSVTMKIFFIPRSDGEFRSKLKVFLDDETDIPYFDLHVDGVGMYPSLGFDRREVLMPVTPVGQTSTVIFEVINYGYDNLNLQYTLPADATTVPMTIAFPNGAMTNIVNTRVPVEVTFSAKKSMSFGTKIEFLDHNGNKYPISVSGTTDASLLTVFPFLTLHKGSLKVKAGERPPQLITSGPIRAGFLDAEGEIEMLDDMMTPHNGKLVDLLPPYSEFLCECKILTQPDSVGMLLDWANIAIFRTPIAKFPGDLLEARGKPIIDVIEASTGKSVPGQIKKPPANRKEEAQALVTQYTAMLGMLKGFGGLVSLIKPEYLLPQELFHKLFLEKGGLPPELRPFFHDHYQLIMEGSWMMLMYQIVTLFVVNRLTPKLLRSTPAVDPELTKNLHLSGSNLYSNPELVLLGWLTYHFQASVPRAQIMNFDSDLHDCRVFGAVIASHVPSLAATLSTLAKTDVLAERIANAQQIVSACSNIGLEYCPTAQQLAQAPARDLILFSVYLFNSLPALVPRATIEYDGRLNDSVVKHIELTNPSGKPLVYSIRVDGDKAFSCADSLKIGARDKIKFPVSCQQTSRGTVKAQIFFIGERVAGSAAGVTLVFDLVASVKTFKRNDVLKKETKLYEQIAFEIPYKNLNTEKDAMIEVSLVPLNPPPRGTKPGNSSPKRGRGNEKGSAKKGSVTSSALLPDMTFWVKVPQFKVKKKNSAVIKINFVPLRLCGHSCLVFIKDSLLGDTCYELQSKVDLPNQTDTNKFQHQMKSTVLKDIPISVRNSGIDRCRAAIMEIMGADGKDWLKAAFEQPQVEYKVEYLTECFSGPKLFSVYGPNAQPVLSPAVGRPQPSMNNKLPLELRPMGPGKYMGRIIMRSAFDVRILDVESTVTALGTRADLAFTCPARQAVSQDIPIINHSDTPWVIHASLSGEYFSGQREFQVPPMSGTEPGKAMYTLTFAPSWIANVAGELTLRNTTVGDSYVYQLTGVGEDPVAEDHVALECVARKRIHDSVVVRNILGSADCEYQVECDLLGISGNATLFVPGDSEAEYDLSIMMPRGGEFNGSISFRAPSGEYIWFTLEVKAENPAYEKEISLEAKARTAILADIPIRNPLDETVTFDVILEGQGLIGGPRITIEPGESASYELIYSPLLADHSEGKLTFVNMQMGEFWYLLHLDAAEAEPIQCEPMEAEIGKSVQLQLTAENPIPEDVEYEIEVTNPINFRVEYVHKEGDTYTEKFLAVDAYHEAFFQVVYTPSAINEDEETKVVLFHPTAGRWEYQLKGQGHVLPNDLPPWDGKGVVEMQAMRVGAVVGQASSNLLSFKNPLNRHLTVQLTLHQDAEAQSSGSDSRNRHEEDPPFQLLVSNRTMHVQPFHEVDLPFLFCPVKMVRHDAVLSLEVVEIDHDPVDSFCFVYPLEGTAEAPGTVSMGKFVTKARERLSAVLPLHLNGVPKIQSHEKIELEIVAPDEHKQMLSKSLVVERNRTDREGLSDGIVKYNLTFEPLKAMRAKVLLRVSLESGGRWVFELDLVAHDADVDDVIRIEGELNQKRSVSFSMSNQFDERVPFNAYFTPDSSAEFSVTPEMGLLEPYSSGEGTNFVVSFTPSSYGKLHKGRLIVETSEMQWQYEVHGDHPKYQVPRHSKPKVETQIHPELDPDVYKGRLTGHKYLMENVQTLKQQQQQNRARAAAGGESL